MANEPEIESVAAQPISPLQLVARGDPAAPIRSDPRYGEWLRKIGFV